MDGEGWSFCIFINVGVAQAMHRGSGEVCVLTTSDLSDSPYRLLGAERIHRLMDSFTTIQRITNGSDS